MGLSWPLKKAIPTVDTSVSHADLVKAYFNRARATLLYGIAGFGLPLIYGGMVSFTITDVDVPALASQINAITYYIMVFVGFSVAILPLIMRGDMFDKPVASLEHLSLWQRACGMGLTIVPVGFLLFAVATKVSIDELPWRYFYILMISCLSVSSIGHLLTALFQYDQAIRFASSRPKAD
jgi:hypothetical protein